MTIPTTANSIRHKPLAVGFYRNIKPILEHLKLPKSLDPDEFTSRVALEIESCIQKNLVVHWEKDVDIQNRMRQEIEDALFELKDEYGIELSFEIMDNIMEKCLDIAKARKV